MAEVVTFVDYRPPARFDLLPWTEVRIEESDAEDGTYTQIEAIPIAPVDPDPEHPAARSFTTQLGAAIDYWYRVVFADATGDVCQPTTPVQNTAGSSVDVVAYATVDEFKVKLNMARAPTAEQLEQMERVLVAAAGEINAEIGRSDDLEPWMVALAAQVNLDRAYEHWQQMENPFGIVSLGDAELAHTARDSWDRHAHKLAPLKQSWGIG